MLYILGFAIFTHWGSLLCALTWSTGPAGAIEINHFSCCTGIGGAFLFANSARNLTDAFPEKRAGPWRLA